MKTQLESWRVTELNFLIRESVDKEGGFQISLDQKFPEEYPNIFIVGFKLDLNDSEFTMDLRASFIFRCEEEILEEFKVSDFPRINAPAIAFPFLRAYISNLTLQSGIRPLMLPSINFIELAKDNSIFKK
jgi:preprotein translocase subunit SecB